MLDNNLTNAHRGTQSLDPVISIDTIHGANAGYFKIFAGNDTHKLTYVQVVSQRMGEKFSHSITGPSNTLLTSVNNSTGRPPCAAHTCMHTCHAKFTRI